MGETMKKGNKLIALFLTLVLILSLAVPAAAGEAEETFGAVVRFEDGADTEALCRELENMPGVSIRWRYEALFQGVAVETTQSALARMEKCAGVEMVGLSRTWAGQSAFSDPLEDSNSLDVMNGLELAYDGDGMVIAVIDSGMRISHEVFAEYGNMDTPALGEEDIEAFVSEGGTDGRYISVKIPFAYDYNGDDRSVHTADGHGTHVAALAAGYSENEEGKIRFRGAAPAAQILAMKVFPDNADLGASDMDVLKAMEDAYLLGADVINLSLGTENGFTYADGVGGLYSETIEKLRASGVIVCCAVGNSASALTGKSDGPEYPSGGYTDYGTVGDPASHIGTSAIAAVNAAFFEVGGGIIVGEQVLSYRKTVSEDENEILPDIDELAGQALTYVVVDGLGKAEDFEGLDLTGCVALVRRGEIYFSEKVENAAAAGAVACLIVNSDNSQINAAVSNTSIPSAVVTLDEGQYMIEQAENGRGNLLLAPERTAVSTGDRLTMLDASSWGAMSDLRIVPTLSAPGGIILSASVTGDDMFQYMSGTSMAAPNASGAFAVMMQALAERGIEDPAQRADLAESLLESTAVLVTDEDGTPLSPRRQGAGVIDLSAAVDSSAVIVEPLLELGDDLLGSFELSFSVRNLSEEDLVFSVDTTVLTDAFGDIEGAYYSSLTPIEITKYVTIEGDRTVTVRAGKEKTVRLTLRVSRELRETFAQAYPNGFFTEGFVTLTEQSGEMIHATFLGYCGDWEKAPILEQVDFRDVMNALAGMQDAENGEAGNLSDALPVDMWYNLVYLCGEDLDTQGALMLGENPWIVTEAVDQRIAMPTQTSTALAKRGTRFYIDLYTLRNAAHVIMIISDQNTGEIYEASDVESLPRTSVASGLAEHMVSFFWAGTDAQGEPLPDGTKVKVEFYAWMEQEDAIQSVYAQNITDHETADGYRWLVSGSYDRWLEWEFPLTLDGAAPAVDAEIDEQNGTLELTVTDKNFVAYAAIQDAEGNYLAEEAFDGQIRGEKHTLTVDLSDCAGDKVYITVADYATNIDGYVLDLAALRTGEEQVMDRCSMAIFLDVSKEAWYHEAVDYAYENGIMTSTGTLIFSPEQKVSRAAVIDALYRIAGMPDVEEVELPFKDVQNSIWYYDALMWAFGNGVAGGYTETAFMALAPVSRQQIAVMLYRAYLLENEAETCDVSVLAGFADGALVAGWAREAMAWAVEEGIFSGNEQGMLDPEGHVTRAQLAQIVLYYCKG